MSPSVRRPGESEPFRDADPGARARRRELLSRRRDDLATMPHAVRGVYVRRFARIGAALAASVVGSLLVAATNSAAVEAALADLGPPPVPAVLLTCLAGAWLAGIVAYLLARCYAEHRFSLRMASAVLPTEDLYGDVERLSHVWPHRVARLMAHRLERPAAAVPVLAAGLVGPLSALYLLEAATSRGYPDPNWFEYLAGDAGPLWLFLACVGAASAALLHLRGPTRSAVTGVAVAGLCSAAAVAVGSRCWPMALVPATAAARLSATTRRERERIDSSELRVEPFDLLDLLAVAALARAAARSAGPGSSSWRAPTTPASPGAAWQACAPIGARPPCSGSSPGWEPPPCSQLRPSCARPRGRPPPPAPRVPTLVRASSLRAWPSPRVPRCPRSSAPLATRPPAFLESCAPWSWSLLIFRTMAVPPTRIGLRPRQASEHSH